MQKLLFRSVLWSFGIAASLGCSGGGGSSVPPGTVPPEPPADGTTSDSEAHWFSPSYNASAKYGPSCSPVGCPHVVVVPVDPPDPQFYLQDFEVEVSILVVGEAGFDVCGGAIEIRFEVGGIPFEIPVYAEYPNSIVFRAEIVARKVAGGLEVTVDDRETTTAEIFPSYDGLAAIRGDFTLTASTDNPPCEVYLREARVEIHAD